MTKAEFSNLKVGQIVCHSGSLGDAWVCMCTISIKHYIGTVLLDNRDLEPASAGRTIGRVYYLYESEAAQYEVIE